MRVEYIDGSHTYMDADTGMVLPGVTGLIKRAALIDDEWYTDEGRERGSTVHRLTADYDLGLLGCPPERVDQAYRMYLLGHVEAVNLIRPSWSLVEEVVGHDHWRFAGRVDRAGLVYAAASVWETKTGLSRRTFYRSPTMREVEVDPHGIQTALQAILVAPELGLPPESINRYVETLRPTGKWKVEQLHEAHDFPVAYDILKRYCLGAAWAA